MITNKQQFCVLITGASSGFGHQTAKLFAQNSHKVIAIARRADRLKSLQDEFNHDLIHIIPLDITKREDVEIAIQSLPDNFKDIDILINNAGGALGLETADLADTSDWETMIDINIKGLIYVTKAVLPIFKIKNKGQIINIGSIAAHAPYKGGNTYGASKAFVWQFTRNLRADLFGSQIKATCIEPGIAETEFSLNRFKGDIKKAESVYQNTSPLTSDDIAQTIYWICNLPGHVNIDNIEIMPLDQTWAGLNINRRV